MASPVLLPPPPCLSSPLPPPSLCRRRPIPSAPHLLPSPGPAGRLPVAGRSRQHCHPPDRDPVHDLVREGVPPLLHLHGPAPRQRPLCADCIPLRPQSRVPLVEMAIPRPAAAPQDPAEARHPRALQIPDPDHRGLCRPLVTVPHPQQTGNADGALRHVCDGLLAIPLGR